ncbi:MAG: CBS domain-containing protein [Pseudomonadota bacterium]
MPASFRPPIARDKMSKKTVSQSAKTNLAADQSDVAKILAGRDFGIVTIGPDETLGRAVDVLREHGIGALVVVDGDDKLAGILSERDIVRKLAETPGQTLPQRVREVMTAEVQTCTMDEPLVTVLRRMTAGRFRHMPVVVGESAVGMVTIGDVVTYRLAEVEQESMQLKQLIVG